MITLVDQIGQSHTFRIIPKRIVSLVPSQTELLVDLGLKNSIQGITKFCVHPGNLRKEKKVVGGTKKVSLDKIAALSPDIILCNKEENTQEMVQSLSKIAPVHVSDIKSLDDTYHLIEQYGSIFNVAQSARDLVTKIRNRSEDFISKIGTGTTKNCMYLIWKNPFMAAGKDTFIDHLLMLNGFTNAIGIDRYPEVTENELGGVDYIFLSSEPFPFKQEHIIELQEKTNAQVVLVDGEYFSWYGSRLLGAFDYFEKLQKQLKF